MSDTPPGSGDIASRVRRALDAVNGLPESDSDNITVLIDAGEWELALDTLCTQVFEYHLEIDRALWSELVQLGEATGVPAAFLLGDPWVADPRNPTPP